MSSVTVAPENMAGVAPKSAANHLFTINKTNPRLLKEISKENFHLVEMTLFS